ncbi:hypothetical protein Q6U52_000900 [Vibrio alginolyticus]|nr:hypothetical protein [Vibrio alginolyticus]
MNEIIQILDNLPTILILLFASAFYQVNFGFTSGMIVMNKFKIGLKGWGVANQDLLNKDQKVLTVAAFLVLIINFALIMITSDVRCLLLNLLPCICIIMTITDSIIDGSVSLYDKGVDFLHERQKRIEKEYFYE